MNLILMNDKTIRLEIGKNAHPIPGLPVSQIEHLFDFVLDSVVLP